MNRISSLRTCVVIPRHISKAGGIEMYKGERIPLDPSLRCTDAVEFEAELRRRVIGQEDAITKVTEAVQKYMAGLNDFERPVANVLLLGPTGTGKTRLVESVCEVLFNDSKAMVRIDCAEFQQSHEVSKIIGSPPGYTGHKESGTQITQEKLDKTHNEHVKLSVLLLDEIEKAHDAFWQLLLGILDRGRLTDNQAKVIDFTKTIIFMTSNLGAREVLAAMEGGIGFQTAEPSDDRLGSISVEAAAKRFSPEFMNRLDHVITFKHLDEFALRQILEIETGHIQKRILTSRQLSKFVFTCSDEVKNAILKEGTSRLYGARYLKRTLEKRLVNQLSNFVLTSQVELGDLVEITLDGGEFKFHKVPAEVIAESGNDEWKDFRKAVDE
jgi:ATP-dependent Clp protease ATP-binding subunit ClpB